MVWCFSPYKFVNILFVKLEFAGIAGILCSGSLIMNTEQT